MIFKWKVTYLIFQGYKTVWIIDMTCDCYQPPRRDIFLCMNGMKAKAIKKRLLNLSSLYYAPSPQSSPTFEIISWNEIRFGNYLMYSFLSLRIPFNRLSGRKIRTPLSRAHERYAGSHSPQSIYLFYISISIANFQMYTKKYVEII